MKFINPALWIILYFIWSFVAGKDIWEHWYRTDCFAIQIAAFGRFLTALPNDAKGIVFGLVQREGKISLPIKINFLERRNKFSRAEKFIFLSEEISLPGQEFIAVEY